MEELNDYSGEFVRGLRYQDFSKDMMAKIIREFGRLYELIDGIWMSTVTEARGVEEAWKYEMEVWKKIPRHVLGGIKKIANIEGDDVATALKCIQLDPCFTGELYHYDLYFKGKNDALMVIYRCPSLLYFEKALPDMVAPLCQDLEVKAFLDYAHYFNPKMETRPLKLPPRKDANDVPVCIWQFIIPE
ncbi:DUF6125 family protein [Chloroflexota bacterium]